MLDQRALILAVGLVRAELKDVQRDDTDAIATEGRGYGWGANPWTWVVVFKRVAP